jgi:hypothetical protein
MAATFLGWLIRLIIFRGWGSRCVGCFRKIGCEEYTDRIQGVYLAGTPYINFPWASDGYSPLDLTLLDHHFGMIEDWRTMISEAHRRGMYVLFDNTFATYVGSICATSDVVC